MIYLSQVNPSLISTIQKGFIFNFLILLFFVGSSHSSANIHKIYSNHYTSANLKTYTYNMIDYKEFMNLKLYITGVYVFSVCAYMYLIFQNESMKMNLKQVKRNLDRSVTTMNNDYFTLRNEFNKERARTSKIIFKNNSTLTVLQSTNLNLINELNVLKKEISDNNYSELISNLKKELESILINVGMLQDENKMLLKLVQNQD